MANLLLVDDTFEQRELVRGAATKAGFDPEREIHCPGSWDEAVALIYEKPFAVAVVDIELWGGRSDGGIDYLRNLHAEQPGCLILAVTSSRGDDAGVRAIAAGAMGFVNLKWKTADKDLEEKLRFYRGLAV